MRFDQLDRPMIAAASDAVRIRPATPADATAAGRILHDAFEGVAEAHGFPKDIASEACGIRLAASFLADPAVFGVVAELHGRVVGSNFLAEGDEVRGVGPITVDPGFQEAGIGRRLMQAVLDRGWGASSVRLVQDAFNTRALALHAALGFEVKSPLLLIQGFPRGEMPRGVVVRPMGLDDIPAADALCAAAHGITRGRELRDALLRHGPLVVERGGHLAGYLTAPCHWPANHGVAETEEDMRALLIGAAAARGEPVSLLMPGRQSALLRWALGAGLRVVKPMTLMARGAFRVPARPWFPSGIY